MITKLYRFIILFISIFILFSILTSNTFACTYESTLINNRLDFKITTDEDKLILIQYIRRSGNSLVTNILGPSLSIPWTYSYDFLCSVYVDYPIGCRQQRADAGSYELGNGAFWQWSNYGYQPYKILPSGIYSLYFDSPPTHDSIGIEYGISQGTVGDAWTFCTRTGDITYPTPTPTPTPSSTPTPSPTPIPIAKTVFAPGITASWNVDALINCKSEPNGDWILAPYAEDIYGPILQAIKESGWELLPFYYDWRKSPKDTAAKLDEFIDGETYPNEKVNYVGHSMGGLVGKDYLDSTQGKKLASFLSVGTPYKGSTLAYPPWEGGETWSNSLIEKIGVTLYLKHCSNVGSKSLDMVHNQIPSLQSLLPVNPYLRSKKSTETYLPVNEINLNNWFDNTNSSFSGVRTGNMAGTGIETTEIIQTKDPNKKDKTNELWADGAPAGKITSFDGDGTVLVDSAILNFANEKIIVDQTSHRGLVNSVAGMSKILEFLGFPNNSELPTLPVGSDTPNSSLVVVGYPANFVVTDGSGKTKQDKDGMVAFMNPKSGSYKVNLLSKSNNTLFIVAQFLPNGEIKYKEYNFRGIGPKMKTLKFDSENPREDILIP